MNVNKQNTFSLLMKTEQTLCIINTLIILNSVFAIKLTDCWSI
jgi:hypothetical protein